MPKIISDLYTKSEQLKGKKLIIVLILIFVVCITLGIVTGNITNKLLKKDETSQVVVNSDSNKVSPTQLSGRVVYIDPNLNPADKISYALVDDSNKQIAYLKANDQKLVVVEGLHVSVYGRMTKTSDGKSDLFVVEKVIAKNK